MMNNNELKNRISIIDNTLPDFNGLTAEMTLYFDKFWQKIKESDDERIKRAIIIGKSRILAWKTIFEMAMMMASVEIAKGKAHISPEVKAVEEELDLSHTAFDKERMYTSYTLSDIYNVSLNVMPYLTVRFMKMYNIDHHCLDILRHFALEIAVVWMANGKTQFYQYMYDDMMELCLSQFLSSEDDVL